MATKQESIAIGVLKDQMKNVQEDVKDIKADMKVGFSSLESKMDDLDKKFAAKWVQSVVGGLVAAILLAFIGVIVAYFIHVPTSDGNKPTTSTTTTTNTPTGSTATTSTQDNGTPNATANANAQSSSEKPTDSQSSNGGVDLTLPKLNL